MFCVETNDCSDGSVVWACAVVTVHDADSSNKAMIDCFNVPFPMVVTHTLHHSDFSYQVSIYPKYSNSAILAFGTIGLYLRIYFDIHFLNIVQILGLGYLD